MMKSGLPIIEPELKAPFAGDLLNRGGCALVFRSIVETFGEECVISLNGKWGTGKTTFLAMWEKYMENFGYKVIHFNSWENEDAEDPLIALIAEFKKIAGKDNEKWKAVASNIGKVVLATLPSIAGKIAGIDLQDIIKDGAKKAVAIINTRIDEYCRQKAILKDFKQSLAEYVEETCNGKPLVFVIDELDRCNPSFAVKTLERIKHIFEVKGIVFVVAIDEVQLCHSIRGFYGSEHIDAKDYLRRFFKIQYDLPNEDSTDIIQAIMSRFAYDKMPEVNENYKSCYKDLPDLFYLLYKGKQMSIRQLEQYILYARLALANCKGLYVNPISVAFIVYIKMFESNFFEGYSKMRLSHNEVIKHFEENYNDEFFNAKRNSPTYLFYNAVADMLAIRCGYENLSELYEKPMESMGLNNMRLKVKVSKFDKESFTRYFNGKSSQMVGLNTLLSKIGLVRDFSS